MANLFMRLSLGLSTEVGTGALDERRGFWLRGGLHSRAGFSPWGSRLLQHFVDLRYFQPPREGWLPRQQPPEMQQPSLRRPVQGGGALWPPSSSRGRRTPRPRRPECRLHWGPAYTRRPRAPHLEDADWLAQQQAGRPQVAALDPAAEVLPVPQLGREGPPRKGTAPPPPPHRGRALQSSSPCGAAALDALPGSPGWVPGAEQGGRLPQRPDR